MARRGHKVGIDPMIRPLTEMPGHRHYAIIGPVMAIIYATSSELISSPQIAPEYYPLPF